MRQRLIGATLVFLAALAIVGQLAWTTAEDTRAPWFSAEVSRDVYSTTMFAAAVLVGVLAAVASGLSYLAARDGRALELRLGILRGGGSLASGPGGIDIDRDIEETLDEILGSVADLPATPVVTVDRDGHDTLVAVATEAKPVRYDVAARELARARAALHKASARIWAGVAGPMAGGLVFLGIASAMLPGSEGFLQTHYVLNTALILFLGYGWTILAGWTAIGLGFARAHEPRPVHDVRRA